MLKLVIKFPSVDSADCQMWLCCEKNTRAISISKRSLVEQELTPSVVEVIKIINQEGLLPVIKVVADWLIINSDIIVTYGEVFLRIQCLHNFGQLLARLPKTGVNFNSEKECFTASSTEKSFSGAVSTEAGVEQPVGQRKQMMWNMAHLWLKAEVNDLESKVKGGGFPQLSPYLVPDISSFCQHLALLKQLRLSKRFVIVVPSVGYGNEEEVWIGDLLASQGKHARAQQELAAQGYFADNIDVENHSESMEWIGTRYGSLKPGNKTCKETVSHPIIYATSCMSYRFSGFQSSLAVC
ncbi:uncharacterized protein LOC143222580 isoform X9 [Tachypleus tridentatus]|uniref:uncharacterized protein LOC143222580 isoform X9 n=1 Tax=Tachypleus tridentatus TaxID=6853 RepID=UPI003FD6805D